MKLWKAVLEGQEMVQALGPKWHEASGDGKVTVEEMGDAIAEVLRNSPYAKHVIAHVNPDHDKVSEGFAGASILATAFTGILGLVKEK